MGVVFDGSEALKVSGPSGLSGMSACTWACWLYLNEYPSTVDGVLALHDSGGSNFLKALYLFKNGSAYELVAQISYSGTPKLAAALCPPVGEWHHIAFRWASAVNSGLPEVFVDGVDATSRTDSGSGSPNDSDTGPLTVGAARLAAWLYMVGAVYDAAIWDSRLTDGQIASLAAGTERPSDLGATWYSTLSGPDGEAVQVGDEGLDDLGDGPNDLDTIVGTPVYFADPNDEPPVPASADKVKVKVGGLEVISLRIAGTVGGVVPLMAAGMNGPGLGRLRYVAADATLAWRAPFSLNYGAPVDVSADGIYVLTDGGDVDKWFRVEVVAACLPADDEEELVQLRDISNNDVASHDVTASESSEGDVEIWTFSVVNESTERVHDLRAWLATANSHLSLSANGSTWTGPNNEADGIALGDLSPSETASLYVRRSIQASTASDPSVLAHVRFSYG